MSAATATISTPGQAQALTEELQERAHARAKEDLLVAALSL
jgi:hypothetical protein